MFVFVLETSDTAPEISLSCQSCIADYLHCPVHGGKADLGVFFSDQIVKVVDSRVLFGLEKYIQDLLSLTAYEHAFISKVLSEYVFGWFHLTCLAGYLIIILAVL